MPLLLIHPKTADVFMARKGDGRIVRHLILDGYEPIGPKGQAAAKLIREQAAERPQ
jgi:hypothetical protein